MSAAKGCGLVDVAKWSTKSPAVRVGRRFFHPRRRASEGVAAWRGVGHRYGHRAMASAPRNKTVRPRRDPRPARGRDSAGPPGLCKWRQIKRTQEAACARLAAAAAPRRAGGGATRTHRGVEHGVVFRRAGVGEGDSWLVFPIDDFSHDGRIGRILGRFRPRTGEAHLSEFLSAATIMSALSASCAFGPKSGSPLDDSTDLPRNTTLMSTAPPATYTEGQGAKGDATPGHV